MNILFLYILICTSLLSGKAILQNTDCQNLYGKNKYNGTCMNVNECTGAALKGDCPNSDTDTICCIPDLPLNSPENEIITKNIFIKLLGDTKRNNALYAYFAKSMIQAKINNTNKAALYFATLFGESKSFKELESSIVDSDFNNELGNNQTGDGSDYRGRGCILLKGKANYILAGSKLSIDLLNKPELASFPSYAFNIAVWIWNENIPILKTNDTALKGDANQLADGTFMSFTMLNHALTPDLSQLKDRANFIDLVLLELNFPPLKRGNGISCSIGEDEGYAVPICLLDFKKSYCGCEGSFENRGCPYGIIPGTTKCRSSSIVKCCKESLRNQLDLVLIVDTSGSIGYENFLKIKKFLLNLISKFEISMDETRISIIEFNDKPNDLVIFSNFNGYDKVKETIENIPYMGIGGTNTAEALNLANSRVLQERNGMRNQTNGVSRVVIVVTDGDSDNNKETVRNAKVIKDRGIYIMTVGIGNLFTNEKELIEVASSRNDAYKIDDYDKIITFLTSLSKSSNQKSAIVHRNTEIETRVNKDSYKYLTVNISTITTDKLYIKLENEANSRTELFASFDDPNPKSDKDYINENDSSLTLTQKKLIRNSFIGKNVIAVELDNKKENLYVSINGLSNLNKFKITVSENPFIGETTITTITPSTVTSTIQNSSTIFGQSTTTKAPNESSTTSKAQQTSTSTESSTSNPILTISDSTKNPQTPSITTSIWEYITTTSRKNSANKNRILFILMIILLPIFNVLSV